MAGYLGALQTQCHTKFRGSYGPQKVFVEQPAGEGHLFLLVGNLDTAGDGASADIIRQRLKKMDRLKKALDAASPGLSGEPLWKKQ